MSNLTMGEVSAIVSDAKYLADQVREMGDCINKMRQELHQRTMLLNLAFQKLGQPIVLPQTDYLQLSIDLHVKGVVKDDMVEFTYVPPEEELANVEKEADNTCLNKL